MKSHRPHHPAPAPHRGHGCHRPPRQGPTSVHTPDDLFMHGNHAAQAALRMGQHGRRPEGERFPEGEGPPLGFGCLEEVTERPDFIEHTDSTCVRTGGGYTVEMKGHELHLYDPDGECFTRIWGDPHVDEGCDGKDDWHFGNDSTFVLPDGTKICLDTEPNAKGEYYVVGVDVLQGSTRYHYSGGEEDGMSMDAHRFDEENADYAVDDGTAGVFVLAEDDTWAVIGDDGHLHDVESETWAEYLQDKDVDFDPDSYVDAKRWWN